MNCGMRSAAYQQQSAPRYSHCMHPPKQRRIGCSEEASAGTALQALLNPRAARTGGAGGGGSGASSPSSGSRPLPWLASLASATAPGPCSPSAGTAGAAAAASALPVRPSPLSQLLGASAALGAPALLPGSAAGGSGASPGWRAARVAWVWGLPARAAAATAPRSTGGPATASRSAADSSTCRHS